jgi:GH24 family phage-related lysozyme (muramidase)
LLRFSIEKSLKGSDIELVKLREGEVLHWYKDSLGKETGGVGHLRRKEDPAIFGQYESTAWLLRDILGARKAADKQFAKLPYQTQALYDVLVSCNFQFGNDFDKDFPESFGHLVKGNYSAAIRGFLGTLWARQTPTRVQDLVMAIRHTIECQTQYQSYE